ncbi:MAG TPA: hypothetical protein VFK52_01550 [Nocardioidaceae bacterium]|nr:hypothetical protein [Nocardioidaceae bacterium]
MTALEERIRRGLGADVTVSVDDMISAAAAGARRSRRQQRWAVGVSAAAAMLAVTVGALAVTRGGNGAQDPVGPATPSVTRTETPVPGDPNAGGQLQSADEYLAGVSPVCGTCQDGVPIEFDQSTGRMLLGWWDADGGRPVRLAVVGPDGLVADLSCPDDFACGSEDSYLYGLARLGPGEAELSIPVADKVVQIVGHDGSVRRTIDLSAAIPEDQDVVDLAWSPDGTRLAVKADDRHVWLLDRESGAAQLVYTSTPGTVPAGAREPDAQVSGLGWSPDGSRLGLTETFGARFDNRWMIFAQRVVSLQLPEPGTRGPGRARTLYEHEIDPPTDRSRDLVAFGAWSPDGTRVAVTVPDQVLEVSADDGSVLAEHPPIDGYFLVWPAGKP